MRVLNLIPAVLLLAVGVLGEDASSTATGASVTSSPAAASATTLSTSTTGSATQTATSSGASPSSTAIPNPDDNPETRCLSSEIVTFPFCSPGKDATWRTDGKYYVTWDSDQWGPNSTVYLTLSFVDFGGAGSAIDDWDIPNAKGFHLISPKEEWLWNQTLLDTGVHKKVDFQTVHFYISNSEPSTDGARNTFTSPNVKITSKVTAPPIDKSPRNRPAASTLGLALGIPLILAFILATVCGTHFCMRTRRQIGPIAIGGGRRHFHKKGYTGRSARRQRAMAGGEATYTDEEPFQSHAEAIQEERRRDAERRDWELASVHGGRITL